MSGEPICFRSFVAARARANPNFPDNPDLLASYHRAANDILAMLAERVEPDWQRAEAALDDIDRLLTLQAAIVSRVADRPAGTLRDVLTKLALWSAAREGCEEDAPPEDALVASALRDLQRLIA